MRFGIGKSIFNLVEIVKEKGVQIDPDDYPIVNHYQAKLNMLLPQWFQRDGGNPSPQTAENIRDFVDEFVNALAEHRKNNSN